jgi:hypothetical protein
VGAEDDEDEGEHQCYLQRPPQQTAPVTHHWAFDTETYTDAVTGQHVANEVAVQSLNLEEPPLSFGSLPAFVTWLLAEQETWRPLKECPVFWAHNLGGYDGHLLLEALEAAPVLVEYQAVYRGARLLGLHVTQPLELWFRDSWCHVGAPLSAFPRIFQLPEARKGTFPYRFNHPDREDYVGALPALEWFGRAEDMTKERWSTLVAWHAAEQARDPPVTWSLQAERRAYCLNDAQLLARGLRKYETALWQALRLSPLRQLTAAAVAMRAYRACFLPERLLLRLPLETQELVRQAYYGGRTEAFFGRYRFVPGVTEGHVEDVVSMYPAMMLQRAFPVGAPVTDLTPRPGEAWRSVRGVACVDVDPPLDLWLPVLPERRLERLLFDLRPKRQQVYCTVELAAAVARGYRVTRVHWSVHWSTWSTAPFREYVLFFFLLKLLTSAPPASLPERQRVWNDTLARLVGPDDEPWDPARLHQLVVAWDEGLRALPSPADAFVAFWRDEPALRTVAKLALNSLYGKFGEGAHDEVQVIRDDLGFEQLFFDPARHVKHMRVLGNGGVEVVSRCAELVGTHRTRQPHVNVPLAAHVTAYARLHLLERLEELGPERVLYCDTDSVYYAWPVSEPRPPDHSHLGAFQHELPPGASLVDTFVAAGPKMYACCVAYPMGQRVEKVRCKGFPSTQGVLAHLHRERMEAAWDAWEAQAPSPLRTVVSFPTFVKNRQTHQLHSRTLTRTMRLTLTKRQVYVDAAGHLATRPWFHVDGPDDPETACSAGLGSGPWSGHATAAEAAAARAEAQYDDYQAEVQLEQALQEDQHDEDVLEVLEDLLEDP